MASTTATAKANAPPNEPIRSLFNITILVAFRKSVHDVNEDLILHNCGVDIATHSADLREAEMAFRYMRAPFADDLTAGTAVRELSHDFLGGTRCACRRRSRPSSAQEFHCLVAGHLEQSPPAANGTDPQMTDELEAILLVECARLGFPEQFFS